MAVPPINSPENLSPSSTLSGLRNADTDAATPDPNADQRYPTQDPTPDGKLQSIACPTFSHLATGTATIRLDNPAKVGNLTVNLTSGTPGVATIPATVTVTAGALTATATVTGVTAGTTILTAAATGSVSKTVTVTVS